jgi:RNA polymerase sigma factor (sigma-70 family)
MIETSVRGALADATGAHRRERAERYRRAAQAPTLRRLVDGAARGDERSWALLCDRFRTLIRAVARQHRLSPNDADDVEQRTWLRLHCSIAAIEEPERLGAWLSTTARRESLRTLSAASREQPSGIDVGEDHAAPAIDDAVIASLQREALRDAVNRLPERHRRLMLALIAEPDRPYAEIAAGAGVPIGSIGPIRARCIDRLRRDERLAAECGP